MSSDSQVLSRVRNIIHGGRYLSLGTANGSAPWVAPLAYVVEPEYSFIYYSATDSIHSRHIALNPVVACAIFDSRASSDDADGIQFSGKVSEVESAQLEQVMDLYFTKSFPDEAVRQRWLRPADDFRGASIQRFYRITPLEMYALDFLSTKVDRRVSVDLDALRAG